MFPAVAHVSHPSLRVRMLNLAAACLAACFSWYPAFAGVNLLANPSFEIGPANFGSFLPLDAGSTSITGWTVTRGQIDYIGSAWVHGHGDRSLDLDGSPGSGGVSQTFTTIPGHSYIVTFRLAGNGGAAPVIKSLRVTAANSQADVQFDTTGTSFSNMRWTRIVWGFTATAASTTIEFYSLNPPSFGGPALDDISVRENGCPADLTGDGFVDDTDFVLFAQQYEEFACDSRVMPDACSADLNFNNFVDDTDFVLFASAYADFSCP